MLRARARGIAERTASFPTYRTAGSADKLPRPRVLPRRTGKMVQLPLQLLMFQIDGIDMMGICS
jgi:hypothetical protein